MNDSTNTSSGVAYRKRHEEIGDAIVCPNCGNIDADLEVNSDVQFRDGRHVAIRVNCDDGACPIPSGWVPIAPSEQALYERINDAL